MHTPGKATIRLALIGKQQVDGLEIIRGLDEPSLAHPGCEQLRQVPATMGLKVNSKLQLPVAF
jgi:hypothetical protein